MEIGYACSFTIDRLVHGGVQWLQPGGPALYSSLGALVVGARPVVYSAVGFDFEEEWLVRLGGLGVDIGGVGRVGGMLTTMFTAVFEGSGRRLYVFNRLGLDEYFGRVEIPHRELYVSCTFGEVGGGTLAKLVEGREVFVDLQGFSRTTDMAGLVRPTEPSVGFKGVRYLKVSHDDSLDLGGLLKRALSDGVEEIVVTRGGGGATVFCGGKTYFCPALTGVADQSKTLGAGDVFGSVYFAYRVGGRSVPVALSAASVAAARFVRRRSRNPFFSFKIDEGEVWRVAKTRVEVSENFGWVFSEPSGRSVGSGEVG